jgi:hypothetical protein
LPTTTTTTRGRVLAMLLICSRKGHRPWQTPQPQSALEHFPRCITCCFYLREGDDGKLHLL